MWAASSTHDKHREHTRQPRQTRTRQREGKEGAGLKVPGTIRIFLAARREAVTPDTDVTTASPCGSATPPSGNT
eukprot:3941623-Rhodomonas_salina.2